MLLSSNITDIRPVLERKYPNFRFFDNSPTENPIKLPILTSFDHVSVRYTFIRHIPSSSRQVLGIMMIMYRKSAKIWCKKVKNWGQKCGVKHLCIDNSSHTRWIDLWLVAFDR